MRHWLRLAFIALSFSAPTLQASIIANSDIDSLTVTTPEKWTAVNESVLFDGLTGRDSATTDRFIGYKNSGEWLSATNLFSIDIGLNTLFDINGFGFYNDWGNQLQQQVATMSISLFDASGNLKYAIKRTNLKLDTFDFISVFQTSAPITGIKFISFDISKIQKWNFEIRELVVSYVDNGVSTSTATISAPGIGIAAFGLITGFIIFRFKKPTK
jgi:hypothetical protein